MRVETYRKDHFLIGLLAGIFLPSIVIVLFYFGGFSEMAFKEYLVRAYETSVLEMILSVSLVMNLGLIYFFSSQYRFQSMRGTVVATLLYGMAIMYLKFMVT